MCVPFPVMRQTMEHSVACVEEGRQRGVRTRAVDMSRTSHDPLH